MRNQEKIIGLLGTVIIHLLAAIIFMSFKLKELNTNRHKEFTIEFTPVEVTEEQKKLVEIPASKIERYAIDDEDVMNIARNLANKPDPEINRDDYIDKVKEELIKSGKLGIDNYIDEQKRLKAENENAIPVFRDNNADSINKPDESEKLAANYQGPTRIYYNLKGRNHTYLPLPIYKCEGSGKIVLNITVDQKGVVVTAEISVAESTTSEDCLKEAAIQSALNSHFNSDINSPRLQQGTISYHFVAQ